MIKTETATKYVDWSKGRIHSDDENPTSMYLKTIDYSSLNSGYINTLKLYVQENLIETYDFYFNFLFD